MQARFTIMVAILGAIGFANTVWTTEEAVQKINESK